MNKFDSIRPYEDSEVEAVLSSLCSNVNVIRALIDSSDSSLISLLPFKEKIISLYLKHKTKNISSIVEYQNLFESIVSNVVNQSINSLSVSGLENLDKNKGYLFISNHRDITLDSALLNLKLHQNGFQTTNNAVGNNLMTESWASDLMRLNKSFIIDRSDKSKKDIYKSLMLASEFICNSILNKNESVWIAQKQGRSKDGIDFTDPAVLKMIHLSKRKLSSIDECFNNLNVVPVTISYEKDPNDLLKTRELYLTSVNSKYEKEPREDLLSIADGIRGQKGNVHLSIGSKMTFISDSYDDI
ncbi:1-acyl-sn-glycerol-3-phosphate acyltransferase, partial [Gammaproteobacteria bacterium]|nr:1-acyl-sn-glycerol-3-phosphate acyltransferase [Gammaproteobacteria bacterium]